MLVQQLSTRRVDKVQHDSSLRRHQGGGPRAECQRKPTKRERIQRSKLFSSTLCNWAWHVELGKARSNLQSPKIDTRTTHVRRRCRSTCNLRNCSKKCRSKLSKTLLWQRHRIARSRSPCSRHPKLHRAKRPRHG